MIMLKSPCKPSSSVTTDKKLPKIALIGCGAIAERYYMPPLARHPSVLGNLVLVDRNEARAQRLAAEFNVESYLADYRELLEDVDGVIIAVPTHLHYRMSMEFLSRGVHVLCEKPLADSADRAGEMVEQARRSGAVLATNYQRRLFPCLVKVKELLSAKTLGEPLSIKYSVGEKFDWPAASGFRFDSKISSGGVLRDRGAHVMDVVCWWLGGKPKVVSSRTDSFGGTEAVARVQFEHNRCVGDVKLSWLGKFPCRFMVKCEAGTIKGEVYDFESIVLKTEGGRERRIRLRPEGEPYSGIAYKMVANFIRVIGQGEKPLVSGGDVLDSIRLIDDCYEAATRFDMPWYEVLEAQSGS